MIYDYIEKYAIAQSILGIDETIAIKDKIIGNKPLVKADLYELDRMISLLRKEYLKREVISEKTNSKKTY